MDVATAAPEHEARLALTGLLVDAFGDDALDVTLAHPGDTAAHRAVWVGGVRNSEDLHAFRGDQGPSVRGGIVVNVHVDVSDPGGTPDEVSGQAWGLVGQVRGAVRDAIRQRTSYSDSIRSRGRVTATRSEGVMPLDRGGYVEHILIEVTFTSHF